MEKTSIEKPVKPENDLNGKAISPKKNKGGRPAAAGAKRTEYFNIRYTVDENNQLNNICDALGLKKTDYIRRKSLDNVKEIIINASALINLLDRVGEELGRSGNNINQLAKHANVMNKRGLLSEQIIERFNVLFESYIKNQVELEKALRKIIRDTRQ